MAKIIIEDEYGERYKYLLCYKLHGYDEDLMSNDLKELDRTAKEMQIKNTGKPLIIVNERDEIVREYSERVRSCKNGAHNKLNIFALEGKE